MPELWPYRPVPEDMHALLRVARRTGATLGVGGNVARALEQLALDKKGPTAVLDAVPPLTELTVESFPPHGTGDALDVLGEIRREWPWAGFFSLRSASASRMRGPELLRISGQPRALFLPDTRSFAATAAVLSSERLLALALDETDAVLIEQRNPAGRPRLHWREGASLEQAGIPDVVRTLLHLAAELATDGRSLKDVDDTDQVIDRLEGHLRAQADVQSALRPHLIGLEFPLLRYLVARGATETLAPAAEKALIDAKPYVQESNQKLASMIEVLEAREERFAFRAVVVPDADGERRVDDFHKDAPLSMTDGAAPWSQVFDDCSRDGLRVSSPVQMSAWQPDRCCRYRDFSRGVAEILWSRPGQTVGEARLPIVYLKGQSEFAFGSGYLTAGGAVSLRLDFGLLGYLNGGPGTVEIAAVWKPGEGDTAPTTSEG